MVFQSIANMAPAASVAFSILFAAQYAGGATPLAVLVGLGLCLLIAITIGQMAKHLPSAGGLYTYNARGLGAERRIPGRLGVHDGRAGRRSGRSVDSGDRGIGRPAHPSGLADLDMGTGGGARRGDRVGAGPTEASGWSTAAERRARCDRDHRVPGARDKR